MRNVRTAVLGVTVAALALTMPGPAAAKVTETWQVAINMPESLSIDALADLPDHARQAEAESHRM